VQASTKADESETYQEPPWQTKSWRRRRRMLDAIGTLFWTYALLKVFVTDIDSELVGVIAPDHSWIVAYRFFAFLAVLVIFALVFRKTLAITGALAYVFGFPLVLLFWKLPKAIYRTRSWVAFLAVVNVLSSFFSNFRYSVLFSGAAIFAGLAVLVAGNHVVLTVAAIVLTGLLGLALGRAIRFSVVPSRFLRIQHRAVRRAVNSQAFKQLTAVNDDLKRADLERFNFEQQNRFVTNLSNSVLSHRLLNFWAFQLEQYRRSSASIVFNALSYVGLLGLTVVGLALINDAIYKIDASAYSFTKAPSILVFIRYTIVGLYSGEIEALKPVSDLANVVSIATVLVGVVILGSLLLTVFLSARQARNETAFRETINEIKAEGERMEDRLRSEYDVSLPEALARLEELRSGLLGLITYISTRVPRDFEDGPSQHA
jgi:hypothetical protein